MRASVARMRELMVVMVVVLSGCNCTPAIESDLGQPCSIATSDAGANDVVDTRFAAECIFQVCLANATSDGGSPSGNGYCSKPCTANSDCVSATVTVDAGTCRAANGSTSSDRFCWFE